MNHRMVFGLAITLVGLVFSVLCVAHALWHPCVYNGIGGLLGGLMNDGTLVLTAVSGAVMCAGLVICFWEAYCSKN